jgi:hypothetical protein
MQTFGLPSMLIQCPNKNHSRRHGLFDVLSMKVTPSKTLTRVKLHNIFNLLKDSLVYGSCLACNVHTTKGYSFKS